MTQSGHLAGDKVTKFAILHAATDCNYEIHSIEASEDMVFVRYTETGTFTNNFFDLPANGNAIRAAGTVWLRFDDGRIVEDWSMSDEWAIQTQLETDFPKDWFFPGWD